MDRVAVIDIETSGLDRFNNAINFIGVLARIDGETKGHVFKADAVGVRRLKELMAAYKKQGLRLIYQNGKFDTLFMEHQINVRLPIHDDVMVMGTAYDLADKHGLKYMAQKYLGVEDWDISKKAKLSDDAATVTPYLKKDLKYTLALYDYFMARMNKTQRRVYRHLLLPAFKMYRDVEREGIYLDTAASESLRQAYQKEAKRILASLKRQHDINWNSSQQVAGVFYEALKLPTLKLSEKTGKPSADAKTLKKLLAKTDNALVKEFLKYKEYYGALTKFLNAWPKYVDENSRVHPSFSLVNVVTGRTSCSDPNLQQVPRKKELRSLYTARAGRTLIEADYSQLELRIAADYANEPTMLKIYKSKGDIHTETAVAITGNPTPTHEERSRAKPVNFGFLYGMSARGFLNYAFDNYGLKFSMSEATRYRDLFFAKYAGLLPWHDRMAEICKAMGGVENRFGRFRALPDIYSSDSYTRGSAARRAINTPVQGTGSDLLIGSAAELNPIIRADFDAHIVGTIHDSILVDCPLEYAADCAKTIQKIMAHPSILDKFGVSFKIPLVADVAIGPWGSK